jgi:hypothetical protein
MKLKVWIIAIVFLSTLIVSVSGYSEKTWVMDLGYEKNEIHKLTFNWADNRSCPEIPIGVGNNKYKLVFDTGCGSGIFFTDVIGGKIDYTLLHISEAFNRNGSHRGWVKRVKISEINIFGDTYKNIETSISDWSMFSSKKFNGTIGLTYFKSKVITLDYTGHKIAVGNNPIDYAKLNPDKYVVRPLYKTTSKGQQDLPFFEAEYNNKPIIVYLDTGKNYSFLYNPDCKNSIRDKPAKLFDIPLKIGNMELMLNDIAEANDFAQVDGLPYPTMIELNSDQIWRCNLLVTFDLIEQKIIFGRL